MEHIELYPFLLSMVQEDHAAVVLCNLDHQIIYMNPAAISNYEKWGGEALLGKSLLDCHNEKSREMINKVVAWFQESRNHNRMYTFHNEKQNKDVYMIALRSQDGTLIGYYEKHEYRNRETMEPYHFDLDKGYEL